MYCLCNLCKSHQKFKVYNKLVCLAKMMHAIFVIKLVSNLSTCTIIIVVHSVTDRKDHPCSIFVDDMICCALQDLAIQVNCHIPTWIQRVS